jgi:hypothetical protein
MVKHGMLNDFIGLFPEECSIFNFQKHPSTVFVWYIKLLIFYPVSLLSWLNHSLQFTEGIKDG